MSKTNKTPAPKAPRKAPKAEKKLRQIKDADLAKVGGGDPCNNCMKY